eukprot:CAMPEP_0114505676 /NCGR_PEP_ID=MMETSP0109-20121206/10986_1 /TAXON_ID=29199 /ORGANISM="Chlorarachnion reptans, Strain CCCM449" /LENGTH=777 /DNA_ID=CAMNT_0001684143 /DNA_START=40 /DNA_END=2373 /DNA_ORIENTATION=-
MASYGSAERDLETQTAPQREAGSPLLLKALTASALVLAGALAYVATSGPAQDLQAAPVMMNRVNVMPVAPKFQPMQMRRRQPELKVRASSSPKNVASTVAPPAAITETEMVALTRAATEERGLAMDGVAAANSGHLGLPLGAAEIGAVLWGKDMTYYAKDPTWINRDRFILSAGHGSMFIYSWLNLAGYDLPIDELKNFRQHHSMTPGHPEFPSSEHNTPGIESTTGPLGQGVSNAVGMAAAEKMAAATYNTEEHKIIDNHIFALAGDGCLQEGVAFEAAAFAAHEKLDNLIVLYDANDVTLDKMAEFTQSEDVITRYKAMGWDAVVVDGHDMEAVHAAIENAKNDNNGKPKLLMCRTIIGKGIEEVAGTNAAHGEAGVKFTDESRAKLGLPEEKFYVSPETRDFFKGREGELKKIYDDWQETYAAWKAANPEKAQQLQDAIDRKTPSVEEMFAQIPARDGIDAEATRISGSTALNDIAKIFPDVISGSADLHGSNKNYISGGGDFGGDAALGKEYTGRNVYYGIREHAMGAIMNGFAYYGLNRPSGATFLVFADYMRNPVRVAALAELPVSYIWTHDSVGVGEDGPTHQPIEQVSSLRLIPNLDVFRPADPEETVAAYVGTMERQNGPTALILTRQNVPNLKEIDVNTRRMGTIKGGYIAKKETGALDTILIASGSELSIAMDAAKELGDGVRVVSMPCMERFDRQEDSYKEEVLPAACRKRVAIEAGASGMWYKYVGLDGKVIGVDRFGFSAPGDIVFKELGFTKDNLVSVAQSA